MSVKEMFDIEFYEQYHQKGGIYVIPVEVFEELLNESTELKKQLHEASLQIQELIEQDIECPSSCSKLKELEKQLERCYCNRTDCSGRIKDSKQYDSLVQKVKQQQQEFIKYLEDEINKISKEIKHYDIWHEVGDINFLILKKQLYKEILQKYKEIIGNGINVGSKGIKDE